LISTYTIKEKAMSDLKPPLAGYSLWLEADEENQADLQALADDLAHSFETRGFLAHATLLGLLDKSSADLDSIRAACAEIASIYNAVEGELIGAAVREAHFQCVFMPMVPTRELLAMNHRARHSLGHEMDPPFMPHWSAVYGDLDQVAKSGIVSAIQQRVAFPRRIQLQTLAVADVDGYPDEWEIIERYPLGGG
jgi:2'-5' RNA ligase